MIFKNGSYIKIDGKRCLNLIHHGVECNHCIGHCPADAIFHHGDRVYLDRQKCLGCGLCLNDCPTGVFRSSQWDETQIIRDIEFKEWGVTELFCARHTLPYRSDEDENRGAIQLPACLSSLSKGAWYELGLVTEIEIHLDQCKDCPMAETLSRLQYNVSTAVEWLEASGDERSFSYIHQGSQGKVKKRFRAIETGLKVTSRRELFISLIDKGKRIIHHVQGRAGEDPAKVERNSYSSQWRKRLAEVFPKNMGDVSNPAYWPTIAVDGRCVNCGLCSSYCPSGALQTIEEDGVYQRCFTNGRCLDCRICQLFCPMEAISRDRQKVESPFDVKCVYSTSANRCLRCGGVTPSSDEDFCYWCEQENEMEDGLKDSLVKVFGSGP